MKKGPPCYLRLFQVELWQTEWNGISLVEVAQEMNLPTGEVASSHFYELFYKRLRENNFQVEKEWLNQKQEMTKLFKEKIDTLAGGKNANIISLGVGLGLIEIPLIAEGYNIHVQECQSESLAYLRREVETKEWITLDLSVIPDNSYELILLPIVSYVFDLKVYQSFLENCSRILNPGGKLVIWDLECPLPFLSGMRSRIKRLIGIGTDISVKWGWLKHPLVHRVLAYRAGLHLQEKRTLDSAYYPVKAFKIMGFVPPQSRAKFQELTFINKKEV